MSGNKTLENLDVEKMDSDDKLESVVIDGTNGDFELKQDSKLYPEPITHGLWTKSQEGQQFRLNQWRILDGNFNYPFNGRCMRGPKFPYQFLLVLFHIICCLGLLFTFEVKQLFEEEYKITCSLIFVVALISFSFMILNGLCVIFTDPGYIERPDWETRMDNFVNYHVDKTPGVEFTKLMTFNDENQACKFCVQCCNYRPPKSEHCQICNSCIERYDHFSPIFGTCIGLRNIGYYIKFLFFANLLFHIIQTVSCRIIYENVCKNGWKYALLFSPTIYVFIFAAFYPPFAIITFATNFLKQMYCLSLDQTTYEWKHTDASLKVITPIPPKLKNLKSNVWNLVYKLPNKSNIDPKEMITAKVIPRPARKIGETTVETFPSDTFKTKPKVGPDSKVSKLRHFLNPGLSNKINPTSSTDPKSRKQRNRHTLPAAALTSFLNPNSSNTNNIGRMRHGNGNGHAQHDVLQDIGIINLPGLRGRLRYQYHHHLDRNANIPLSILRAQRQSQVSQQRQGQRLRRGSN